MPLLIQVWLLLAGPVDEDLQARFALAEVPGVQFQVSEGTALPPSRVKAPPCPQPGAMLCDINWQSAPDAFIARRPTAAESEGARVLLGVSGGIAAYKAAELVRRLGDAGAEVRVVLTANAARFVAPMTFQALSGHPVRTSLWDESAEAAMGHIELARWADEVLVAPASADLLARLAHGLADDLLTTLCLATAAPVSVAPAMNQQMWAHAATQANVVARIGGAWVTPSLGECGVAGIMRRAFREWSAGRDARVEERALTVADIRAADALVLTNALIGAWPVVALDGRPLSPDPAVREFNAWLDRA